MEIVNRVAQSTLITIDLGDFIVDGERVLFDLKNYLYMDQILREKDFREFIQQHDCSIYQDKHVAITCSVDAIIPHWAFMLVSSKLQPFALTIYFGDLSSLENHLIVNSLSRINLEEIKGKKIVIKGCGEKDISPAAFVEITRLLRPYAASIMYGEPCSTVPVYKRSIQP